MLAVAVLVFAALSSPCAGLFRHCPPPFAFASQPQWGAAPSASFCPRAYGLGLNASGASQQSWSSELSADGGGGGSPVLSRRHKREGDKCNEGGGNSDGGEYEPPLSPREWMENAEAVEGTGGAYTVIRCDLSVHSAEASIGCDPQGNFPGVEAGWQLFSAKDVEKSDVFGRKSPLKWRIWGKDFHLDRLKTSYRELMKKERIMVRDAELDAAIEKSEGVVRDLLTEAELAHSSESVANVNPKYDEIGGGEAKIVMLTLLWTQNRGSITATVALPFSDEWSSLPNRWESSPEAKLSSWCRIRRPLENWFKTEGVGEVLLARPLPEKVHDDNGEAEILEGLTSNLFVVYTDGTLRTAGNGVLGGYARDLVLRSATEIGITIDTDMPILLSDAQEALWEEVFVTSSMRLIVPVSHILAPSSYFKTENRQHASRKENGSVIGKPILVWSERVRKSTPLWRTLSESISRHSFG